ncbi:glycerate kinase [Lentibacillus sp. Marseille-P4043]|uniref:glycerate kinase n=1 Tax=Lentibacillus sp. Marseille-P4043 TaxID=2040293 RepID=UPI000D0B3819|nr:glycerate kinase [Lentibacillus sp. Marseille-P4043]
MNIVIAPDSFKGSLTSAQASEIMRKAVLEVLYDCEVYDKPMADGGEGTLDSMLASSNGVQIPISCVGPLGERINTSYGIVRKATAIIECARIAGLTQVPEEKRNPDMTTSYGVGEVIINALNRGCTSIVLGLGGSATNDGGLGMLQALGMKAWDEKGAEIGPFGCDLLKVAKVNFAGLDKRLKSVAIKVASDVDNPLCGNRGASAVYGPQKGATRNQIKQYDQALRYYGNLIETEINQSVKDVAGSGAAGGLGFALLAIGAELVSGAKLIAKAANLESKIKFADLVLTGEGQSDAQTLYGKAPGYVAEIAEKYRVPTVLISGSLTGDLDVLQEKFAGCFSIIDKPLSLEACMANAGELLFNQTKQVVYFWRSIKKG